MKNNEHLALEERNSASCQISIPRGLRGSSLFNLDCNYPFPINLTHRILFDVPNQSESSVIANKLGHIKAFGVYRWVNELKEWL